MEIYIMEKKYFRECPLCSRKLGYTIKKNKNYAEKNKKLCSPCSQKEAHKRPEVKLKTKKRALVLSKKYCGSGNPFYGKKHSDETKEKISKVDKAYTKTAEFKEKSARHGKKNGMYGKSIYNVWVDKYGKEEANSRMVKLKKKRSINASGKNNPMYGKPSPQGSGNGWSGWYKGWFFRSLKELSYVINIIEAKKLNWRTAETKDLRIKYIDYKGDERTYLADFLVEEKELIEVKPIRLKASLTVRLKQAAAEIFCKKMGFIYKIEDVDILKDEEIKELHIKKKIVFTKRYEKKYKNFLLKGLVK